MYSSIHVYRCDLVLFLVFGHRKRQTWLFNKNPSLSELNKTHRGALHSEVQRSNAAKEKRSARKARAENSINTPPLSGARPVAGASMPASVSSAISGHTAECSQMSSDMAIFVNRIDEHKTTWDASIQWVWIWSKILADTSENGNASGCALFHAKLQTLLDVH